MKTQPIDQNDIELRIRTLRTLWIAGLLSIGGFFLLTIFAKPSEDIAPNPTLSLILLGVGLSTTLSSILVRNKLLSRAVDQQQVPMVQQAYVVGWAVNEVAALLGLLDYFMTSNRFYYAPLIVSVCGQLLHFPRREAVLNAAFKNAF